MLHVEGNPVSLEFARSQEIDNLAQIAYQKVNCHSNDSKTYDPAQELRQRNGLKWRPRVYIFARNAPIERKCPYEKDHSGMKELEPWHHQKLYNSRP
jgi:hypothetical protein